MNVEQKLDFFSNSVMHEAELKRARIMEEIDKETRAAIKRCETKAYASANSFFLKEKYRAQQEKNKIFTAASVDAKKSLAALKEQLMGQLKQNVTDKLRSFVVSAEYQNYLTKQLEHCLNRFNEANVLLMKRDLSLVTGKNKILPSDDDFIGGFKIMHKNIIIDNSFLSRLDEALERFDFM